MPAMEYESEYGIEVINRFAGLDFEVDDPTELVERAQQKEKALKADKKQAKTRKGNARTQEKAPTVVTKEVSIDDTKRDGFNGCSSTMSTHILSAKQLEQARRYIQTCGSSKNPISLLMEVGQQLFQTPIFELFEPNVSSVHQHVFTCSVRFFNYEVEYTGYNKKKVKTEAACCMIEKIKQGSGMDLQTQNKKQSNLRSLVSMPEQKPSPTANSVFSLRSASLSNTKKPIDSPLQKSTMYWQRPHTTSPPPNEKTQIVNSRLGVRALNHHLGQLGLVANQQSSTDDISNVIFDNAQQSTSCVRTALERLKTLMQQEKMEVAFHDLEGDGTSHLCLLEAKLKLNFVCHGIGENQPQARENAAENLLFVIDFFKGKPCN